MTDEGPTEVDFPNAHNIQLTTELTYAGAPITDVSFTSDGFTMKPIEKKGEDKEVSTFIAAIFPNRNGEYTSEAKQYIYEICSTGSDLKEDDLIHVVENTRVNLSYHNTKVLTAGVKNEPYGATAIKVVKIYPNVNYECMPIELETLATLGSWTKITKYEKIPSAKIKLQEEWSLTTDTSNLYMNTVALDSAPNLIIDSSQSIRVEDSSRTSFKNGQEFKVYNMEDNNMDMKKLIGDFTFGKFNDSSVKYSFNGIAFRAADGTYNVYNENGTLTNVSDMVIDIPVFAIPVAKADIKVGDVILHPADRTPLVVKENAQTAIIAVEPKSNEVKTFAPKKSIFGFDFYTKITTPMDMFGGANADESNPFGNMLPFLMFSDGEFDMNTMLMFTMMNGKGNKGFDTNMMLPLMLMSDKKGNDKIDPFMLMLMTGGNFGNFGKSNATKDTNEG